MTYPFKTEEYAPGLQAIGARVVNVVAASGVAYVPIPKVACTSLKMAFWEQINRRPFEAVPDAIHGEFDYFATDLRDFRSDRSHRKMVVIREPIARFVSAYNSRVVERRELSREWAMKHAPGSLDFFAKHDLTFNPGVNEMVERLSLYVSANYSTTHHFLPQRFSFQDLAVYDAVFRLEEGPKPIEESLSDAWDHPVTLPKVQESQPVVTAADLSTASVALLRSYYADDFEAYELSRVL